MDNSKTMEIKGPGDILEQLLIFISKSAAYIGLIVLGIIGRFSLNLLHNRKMTWAYIVGYSGLSFVVGYIACAWMQTNCPNRIPVLLPITTLLSNNLVSFLMTIIVEYETIKKSKWKGIMKVIFKDYIGKEDGE